MPRLMLRQTGQAEPGPYQRRVGRAGFEEGWHTAKPYLYLLKFKDPPSGDFVTTVTHDGGDPR
jgi:hypothetical protein